MPHIMPLCQVRTREKKILCSLSYLESTYIVQPILVRIQKATVDIPFMTARHTIFGFSLFVIAFVTYYSYHSLRSDPCSWANLRSLYGKRKKDRMKVTQIFYSPWSYSTT